MGNNSKNKEILFKVTADDCRWDYFKGSGNGGQNKQKTSSGVRCTHLASGAVGQSTESRSQFQNKKAAFARMTQTDKFRIWIKMETARRCRDEAAERQEAARIERYLEHALKDENISTQVKINGDWVEVDPLTFCPKLSG
jgi:peptide chain release factor 1